MSRPFIIESDFVEKLKNNDQSKCINCNMCFEIYKSKFKRCVFHNEVNEQLLKNFKY